LLVTRHSLLLKKRLRRFQLLESGATLFPFQTTEVIRGEVAIPHVHTGTAVCIPEICVAVYAFRSALDLFSQTIASLLENTVPFGFCCGGFSSTAGYVPGNEASVRLAPVEATYASLWPFLSSGCHPFLSGRSRKPRGLPWQAFRLQRGVSIGRDSRLSFPSDLASPQRPPFPSLVTPPASGRD
jgi:hypothetical protein